MPQVDTSDRMEAILQSGRYFKIKLHSRSERSKTQQGVAHCLRQSCDDMQLSVVGFMNRNDRFVELPNGDVASVLPQKRAGSVILMLSPTDDIELTIRWIPPDDPILLTNPVVRLGLDYRLDAERGSEFAKRLFTNTANACRAFWGELIDYRVAPKATFARLNSHEETIPHLACANFFGPEYIQLFGGIDKLRASGFAEVTPMGDGTFVLLGEFRTQAEFLRRQSDVATRLAPPGVIGGERRTSFVPQFHP